LKSFRLEAADAGIGLVVSGIGTFDVTFDQQATAGQIYGPFPGDEVPLPPFFTVPVTEMAANALNAALTASTQDVRSVGKAGTPGTEGYNIGDTAFICCRLPIIDDPEIPAIAVIRSILEGDDWVNIGENFLTWDADDKGWAIFTPIPEPDSSLLAIAALATLRVVCRRRRKGSEGRA